MALVECELVHDQTPQPTPIRVSHLTVQALLVDCLDGVPVQPQQLSHLAHRQQSHEGLHVSHHRGRQRAPTRQPGNVLDTHPTARTAHPPDWHIQPDAPPQQVTFANAPQRRLMDAGTSLAAPATARQRLGLRPQHQQQALIAQFMDIVKFEAFPEQGKHFRLLPWRRSFAEVDWSRVPSKSNRRSAAFYISRPPLIREEPFFMIGISRTASGLAPRDYVLPLTIALPH